MNTMFNGGDMNQLNLGARLEPLSDLTDIERHERATTGVDRRHWFDANTNGFSDEGGL